MVVGDYSMVPGSKVELWNFGTLTDPSARRRLHRHERLLFRVGSRAKKSWGGSVRTRTL